MLLSPSLINSALSYAEYISFIDELVKNGQTSGPNQSEALVAYTKLNKSRMKRVTKRAELTEKQIETIKSINRPQIWLALTETWCGDAATNLPILAKMCDLNPLLELKLILRDEHLDLMDQHLTNGGRSIPKVLMLDKEHLEFMGSWGPRPAYLQDLLAKNKHSQEFSADELKEHFQRWYIEDRGRTTAEELLTILVETQPLH